MRAIVMDQYGGPGVLRFAEVTEAPLGPHDIRVKNHAVGLNYIDTYHRTGVYPVEALPATIGMEGAGEVIAVGEAVTDFVLGDRVAYASPMGSYAETRVMPAARAVKLPEAIAYQTAAAMMLQGMTTEYLLNRTYPVGPNTVLLMHAAAGGVGLMLCQWARAKGATIIGTVSSEEKAALAKANGCTHTINYRNEDFVARTRELTGGRGVDVVYDGIGKDTFPASLDCLRPRGLWVSFGNASGVVPPFDIGILSKKGSLFATRPTLMTYTASRADLLTSSQALFDMVLSGNLTIHVNQTYPLAETAQAHADLEAGRTTGSTVLIP